MSKKHRESVPAKMRPIYESIVSLTDEFCKQHLNEEYAQVCRKMAATLSRKRPSPLMQGKFEIWACAIVHALGRINFLFDKTQAPHMRADDLCSLMGVSQSTASAKASKIMETLDIMQMDPEWWLPSRLDKNPLVWLVEINGYLVDLRQAPREIQEEAYRMGIIPYIPTGV
jgi:hypothetical protein